MFIIMVAKFVELKLSSLVVIFILRLYLRCNSRLLFLLMTNA
ncbi:MAG: hypothetical protein OFPI_12030 [Osedax symbiont Rs2]|nr:MAG: hypothetical protein OFPI_12030 [Osedax symbiont Rs2]